MTTNEVNRPTKKRAALSAALMTAACLSLAACNATRGAGEDVSSVGHDTSQAATNVQQGIANTTGAASR
ncbi:hypothetical protein AA101099_2702 [Neoasaia chiangmaiensis NBRC 101099]|uniref:Entericidin n=1 Tax=Neoasaia chiangmaiensis TaxID=320497 RepID=A0A1U9KPB1_9PROT|nr:entericidin [Neoasaia chiangmaiensis]AQS87648.1 entericidin [Neoasaia chiangmaiensis]GBR41989.1 hypothetical protein AA101099_2702 [Neoasaia chiangmaiensis NBRC 101099]GEN14221.1 hypothetical protein NCH01_06520 [Neoasaia chiangmaiensis]